MTLAANDGDRTLDFRGEFHFPLQIDFAPTRYLGDNILPCRVSEELVPRLVAFCSVLPMDNLRYIRGASILVNGSRPRGFRGHFDVHPESNDLHLCLQVRHRECLRPLLILFEFRLVKQIIPNFELIGPPIPIIGNPLESRYANVFMLAACFGINGFRSSGLLGGA